MQRCYNRVCLVVMAAGMLCALPVLAQQDAMPQLPVVAAPAPLPAVGLPALPATRTEPAAEAQSAAPGVLPALPASTANDSKKPPAAVSNPATTVPAVTVEPASTDGKPFSYGTSNISVLFLPTQMAKMKEAISTYEIANRNAKPVFEEVRPVVVTHAPENVVEPAAYPVFFLSSIAYDGPSDWSIWVGSRKITSRKNDTDVSIVSVSRDNVTFTWKPEYSDAIIKRNNSKQFAPTDPVKNKLAVVQRVSVDAQTGMVTFTLRQNQSFAVGYFHIFEGYVDAPKLPTLTEANAPSNDLGVSDPSVPGMSTVIDPVTGLPRVSAPGMQPEQPRIPGQPPSMLGQPPGMSVESTPPGMPPTVQPAQPPMMPANAMQPEAMMTPPTQTPQVPPSPPAMPAQ